MTKKIWDIYAPVYELAMRPERKTYQYLYERIRTAVRGKEVLEIATGPGLLARHVASAAARMIATDYSEKMIAEAKKRECPGNLRYEVADATALPYGDDSFDAVVLSHTLQQVRHPDALLREIVRVGKRAIVNVINFGHLPCRAKLFFSGRMPETEAIPYHWYDTPNIHLGTLSDFRNLCRKLGIVIVREIPLGSRHTRLRTPFPNLFAPGCVFELEKRHKNQSFQE